MDCSWEYYSGGFSGLNIDGKNLESTFSSFGYDVLSFKNLQAHEILRYLSPKELLREIDKKKETETELNDPSSFKNYLSLVVCILGHGAQGVVYGVDNFPVYLNVIQYDAFDNKACLDLSGKPKVFIIFACQGEKVQQGTLVSVPTFPIVTPTTTNFSEHSPQVVHFIRLVSTIEGYQCFGGKEYISNKINLKWDVLHFIFKIYFQRLEKWNSFYQLALQSSGLRVQGVGEYGKGKR